MKSPLAGGWLSGKYGPDSVFPENDVRRHHWPPEKREAALRRIAALSFLWVPGTGRTPVQAALKFCLSHPAVSVVIPGIKTPPQAEENLAASAAPDFSEEELRRLADVLKAGA